LNTVVAVGSSLLPQIKKLQVLGESFLQGNEAELLPEPPPMPWDIGYIIYTSGTTGPSKGVLISYYQMWNIAATAYGYVNNADRVLVNMPLYHVAALGATVAVLVNQASMYLTDGFHAHSFWEDVVRTNCTVACGFVGTMAQYLDKHSDPKYMADNPLRMTVMYPISAQTVAFCKKFGISYFSGFGLTEVPICLVNDIDTTRYGSVGIPRTGVQCRLVDDNDIEIARGSIGELIVRSDYPWGISPGYNGMPEATVAAWRNGWFHTGDLFRQDEDGYYYFVDRKKDIIRRRGENISSFDVENAVAEHPSILEAAAVGVPAEHGEEDVFVAVTLRSASEALDERSLFEFLRPRLAHFMLPRYIRTMDSLPKTPSNKVQKHLLRTEGVVPGTWDREAAGIVIKREKLNRVRVSTGESGKGV